MYYAGDFMKLIVLCLALTFSVTATANKSSARPANESARFVYLETQPNSDKEITVQSIKCDPKKNDLSVQTFVTESKVVNGTVNVLNVYARSGGCKESPYSSVWTEKIKPPKNGKFSHIYITILSDNITVL